jgi:hypothetical protein
VAAFIGSPAMNLVEATVGDGELRFGEHVLPLPPASPLRGIRFIACLDGRRAPGAGGRATLAVDHHELHFFDPATGDVLDARPEPAPAPSG